MDRLMRGYWIVRVKVEDDSAYKQYAEKAALAIKKFGGKYLVRGGNFEILEGTHNYPRNVVVEFLNI